MRTTTTAVHAIGAPDPRRGRGPRARRMAPTLARMAAAACCSATGFAVDASTEPLVQLGDLSYVGSFRLPGGQLGAQQYSSFDYACVGCAFDPARHGLYLMGHIYAQLTAEVSIPQPLAIANADLSPLPTATLLQDFADITDGQRNQENVGNGVNINGLLLYGGRLYGTVQGGYDASGQQTLTHFYNSPDLTVSGFEGLFRVAPSGIPPRMLGGYMTPIPSEWQAALGGPVLTGAGGGSIISGTSFGPSAFAFDPAQLGVAVPPPATPLEYYPASDPTLGPWGGPANPPFNMCTGVTGLIFPPGSRTALMFGTTGLGKQEYGEGTANPALDGTIGPDGELQCYDPVNSAKGCHAYPYTAYMWAYDANDLAAAASGAKQPWQVVPYATGNLTLPIDSGANSLAGVAYDPSTRLLYIPQIGGDQVDAYSYRTLVHVYQLPAYGSATTGTATGTGTATSTTGTASTGGTATATTSGSTSGATGGSGGGSHCGLGGGLGALALALAAWRRAQRLPRA
jgi:hypothetical protein